MERLRQFLEENGEKLFSDAETPRDVGTRVSALITRLIVAIHNDFDPVIQSIRSLEPVLVRLEQEMREIKSASGQAMVDQYRLDQIEKKVGRVYNLGWLVITIVVGAVVKLLFTH